MSIKTKQMTTDSELVIPECPDCHGYGWIVYEASVDIYKGQPNDKATFCRRCPTCQRGQAVVSARSRSMIPESFSDKRLSAFNWQLYIKNGEQVNIYSQKDAVESFVRNFKKWQDKGFGLYIFSKTKGSGKTFLASCIANEIMSTYAIRCRFVSVVNLISIQQNADADSDEEAERNPIDTIANVPLLVLDDIGAKVGNKWLDEILFTIMDNRYQRRLPTLITSNVPVVELPHDGRIIDRILAICIEMSLPEVRVRAKDSNSRKVEFFKELGLLVE